MASRNVSAGQPITVPLWTEPFVTFDGKFRLGPRNPFNPDLFQSARMGDYPFGYDDTNTYLLDNLWRLTNPLSAISYSGFTTASVGNRRPQGTMPARYGNPPTLVLDFATGVDPTKPDLATAPASPGSGLSASWYFSQCRPTANSILNPGTIPKSLIEDICYGWNEDALGNFSRAIYDNSGVGVTVDDPVPNAASNQPATGNQVCTLVSGSFYWNNTLLTVSESTDLSDFPGQLVYNKGTPNEITIGFGEVFTSCRAGFLDLCLNANGQGGIPAGYGVSPYPRVIGNNSYSYYDIHFAGQDTLSRKFVDFIVAQSTATTDGGAQGFVAADDTGSWYGTDGTNIFTSFSTGFPGSGPSGFGGGAGSGGWPSGRSVLGSNISPSQGFGGGPGGPSGNAMAPPSNQGYLKGPATPLILLPNWRNSVPTLLKETGVNVPRK